MLQLQEKEEDQKTKLVIIKTSRQEEEKW